MLSNMRKSDLTEAAIRDMFIAIDADNSGEIDRAEMVAVLDNIGLKMSKRDQVSECWWWW